MMMKNKTNVSNWKVAVIGAGSWGTALALHLARRGVETSLWGHRKEHIEQLQQERENKRYLPGHTFPECLHISSALTDVVSGKHVVCMVVPSHVFRESFINILEVLKTQKERPRIYLSATKGIENDSLSTMTQILNQCLKEHAIPGVSAVLSGPSFAREVAQQLPTAITIGSDDEPSTKILQKLFNSDYFRVYTSHDVIGLEISAALKNIIAIAAGICDGLGFGNNARAALITRGLVEITRMGTALGAEKQTFYGLSGLGDLVLTCTGDLSRNRYVGIKLGEGQKIETILNEMSMIAEGVKTTRSVYGLAKKFHIEMPILEQIHNIIYCNKDTREAAHALLTRDLKQE